MAPLARPLIRTILVMSALVGTGYVLRPVAWEIEARLHDAKELLYHRVGGHTLERQGVELPLATDENGLRLDVLEKIGSEELAKQEQRAKQESKAAFDDQGALGAIKIGRGQTGQQPKKVTTRDPLTQYIKDKEEGAEGGGGNLFGRLTRRGAWRGIVGPYLGKNSQMQTKYDGKRTTIADVESSDEETKKGAEQVDELDEERGEEFEEVDGGRTVGGEAGRGNVEKSGFEGGGERSGLGGGDEGEDSWLQNLIGNEEEDGGKERLSSGGGVTLGERKTRDDLDGQRRVELDTGPGVVEESKDGEASLEEIADGVTKEGVKTFLAVNADLASGGADDEAVSGAGGMGGALAGAGEKPKPREVVEEENELVGGEGARVRDPGGLWEAGTDTKAGLEENREGEAVQADEESVASQGTLLQNGAMSLENSGSTLLQNSSEARFNRSAALFNSTAALLNSTASLLNGSESLDDSFSILPNSSIPSLNVSAELSNSTLTLTNDSLPSDAQSTVKSWPLVEAMMREIWEAPPAGVGMPPREEFTLRKEMVEHRAVDNTIVVTFANFAFLDFTTNWVRHLTDLGVTNILVGAMDEEILEALFVAGIPVFDMKSEMSPGDAGWGSPVFHKMGRERLYLVDALLGFGVELLMCDTDMVFLRDPLEYVSRYPQADVLTSSDHLAHTVDDESLERWQEAGGAYNIGIIHYRPTAAARAFAREWLDVATKDDLVWDQNAFNDIMRRQFGPATEDENGLVYAYDGTLKLGILPVSLFCSGHTYFVQKIYKTTKLAPFAIHTTFQYGGTDGKRHRLREAKVFHDEPEYYDPEGGLLAYRFDIPTELLSGGEHTVETHFALVNYQLLQLRNAFALAQTLNRTLVLPELWCRFDRLWYPHNGILDGTATPQPFLCPADHVLEINKMVDGLPREQFGEDIPFREYSLLDNPRLPAEILESKVDVFVCKDGDAACTTTEVKQGLEKPTWVVLERDPSDSQVKALLEPYSDTKLLSFSTMDGAFGGFEDKVLGDRFRARVKQYVGIWCCIHAHPGHIYYDMYWDEKPGWMPKPPKDPTEDHPPLRLH